MILLALVWRMNKHQKCTRQHLDGSKIPGFVAAEALVFSLKHKPSDFRAQIMLEAPASHLYTTWTRSARHVLWCHFLLHLERLPAASDFHALCTLPVHASARVVAQHS